MLSLGEGEVKICDLVSGRTKQAVYYLPDVDEKKLNRVSDLKMIFGTHTDKVKSRLRVNQLSIDEGLRLLEQGREPDEHVSKGTNRAYWALLKLKKSLLSREMDIRDQKKATFQINIPKNIDEFFGHVGVLGPTGSGKGYWITGLIIRMWRATNFLNRRRVYYVSAEAELDKTLNRLRIEKYEDWFVPIDCSYEAGIQSGLSPQDFWEEKIDGVLKHVRNGIIVLDDCQDGYYPKGALKTQDMLLRIGRHRNNSIIAVFHSIKNGQYTRQLCQSAWHLVLFGRAQRGRVRDFFNEVLGMPRREAQELVDHMNHCGRASVIRTLAPVSLICEKYIRLL